MSCIVCTEIAGAHQRIPGSRPRHIFQTARRAHRALPRESVLIPKPYITLTRKPVTPKCHGRVCLF